MVECPMCKHEYDDQSERDGKASFVSQCPECEISTLHWRMSYTIDLDELRKPGG